jgi:hypothetical protein
MIFSPICADDVLLGFPQSVSENDDTLVRTDEEDEEDRREDDSVAVNVPELLSPDNLDVRCWIPLTLDAVGPFVKPGGKAGNAFSCPWPTLSGGLASNTSSFLAISRSCTVSYRYSGASSSFSTKDNVGPSTSMGALGLVGVGGLEPKEQRLVTIRAIVLRRRSTLRGWWLSMELRRLRGCIVDVDMDV